MSFGKKKSQMFKPRQSQLLSVGSTTCSNHLALKELNDDDDDNNNNNYNYNNNNRNFICLSIQF